MRSLPLPELPERDFDLDEPEREPEREDEPLSPICAPQQHNVRIATCKPFARANKAAMTEVAAKEV